MRENGNNLNFNSGTPKSLNFMLTKKKKKNKFMGDSGVYRVNRNNNHN